MKNFLTWLSGFFFGKPSIQKVLPSVEVLQAPPPRKKTLADYNPESLASLLKGYGEDEHVSNNLRARLLNEALNLAKTPEDWRLIYQAAEDTNIDDKYRVMCLIEQKSWTQKEWEQLRNLSSPNGLLGMLVFKKLLGYYNNKVDILKLYMEYKEKWEIGPEAMVKFTDKLSAVATKQDAELIQMLAQDTHLRVWAICFLSP